MAVNNHDDQEDKYNDDANENNNIDNNINTNNEEDNNQSSSLVVDVIADVIIGAIDIASKFVSFKDGKIGVNFGGYHAEAGLGALLTGNAAHGGLSASAGTPYGQRAAAGIGGGTGENSQGGAYASASAGGNVGASAGLGAVAGGDAGVGAEAHVGSLSTSANRGYLAGSQVSKQATSVAAINNNGNPNQNNVIYRRIDNGYDGGEIDGNAQTTNIIKESHIQRIKPPKKYARVHGHAHVAQPSNQINKSPQQQILVPTTSDTVQQIESQYNIQQQTNNDGGNINSESLIIVEKSSSPAAKINKIEKRHEQQIPIITEQQQYQQQQQQQQQHNQYLNQQQQEQEQEQQQYQQRQQQVNNIAVAPLQNEQISTTILGSKNFVKSATTDYDNRIPNEQQQNQQQINIQKNFEYNTNNDKIPINTINNANIVTTVSASSSSSINNDDNGSGIVAQSSQPVNVQPSVAAGGDGGAFVTYYRKHFRPWRRIHYRKQFVPVIYEQPQTVTVVEKTAAVASPQPSEQIFVGKTFETVPTVGKNNVITKTKTKSILSSSSTPYGGTTYQQRPNDNNGYGGGSVAGTGAISANFNAAGLFDSIFNIPIATLKAVNGLVNNVANGISASGSVAVSKSVGTGPY